MNRVKSRPLGTAGNDILEIGCHSCENALVHGEIKDGLPHPPSPRLRRVRNDEYPTKVRHHEEQSDAVI